ncbi:MAG: hypothetical protein DRJ10_10730, partial [Bacteroidetes bacterium]
MKKTVLILIFSVIWFNVLSQKTGCISGDCDNGYGTWVYKSGAKYVGYFSKMKFHGQGKFYYANGDTYKGYFANDKYNGYGVYYNKGTGDKYTGYWKNEKKYGQGTIVFGGKSKSAGEKYKGNWVNDMRDGWGTYYYKNGDKYVGRWKFNKLNGEGSYFFAGGKVEKAYWANGKRYSANSTKKGCISGDCDNGYGTYVFKTGEKYAGNWKNLKRNGKGINYFVDGEWYKGDWVNDQRQGQGINYSANGDLYEGQWKGSARHGFGVLTKVNGEVKKGLWEYGRYVGTGNNNYGCISGNCDNGYGVYNWRTGEKYAGYWKNKKKDGKGTNYWKSGDKYVGKWSDNLQNGYGIYTFANGQIQEGFFRQGKYIGKKVSKSGCVTGNCNNGFGTYILSNGDRYLGTFSNGKYSGQGTYKMVNGNKYSGEFSNHLYHGAGTFTFANNKGEYIGEFAYGKYDGKGTFYFADGRTKAGIWKQGKFVGEPKSNFKLPVLTWIDPPQSVINTTTADVKIKLCIKSKDAIEYIKVYNNDSIALNNAVRGYNVVDESCDYTINKVIKLNPGPNKIKVVTKNIAGEASSKIRIFNYDAGSNAYKKRFALVIGNGKYDMGPLRNPENDALSIAAKLKKMGFDVMIYTDLSQENMKKRIREFGNKITESKGVGLFFFAGHGLQVSGENYVVPVDAHISNLQDIEEEAVNLSRITGEMAYAKNDLNIIILDACRNNPFEGSDEGGGKGLASAAAPSGTFIAFATAPGSVAADGTGNNGLYTQELLKA